MRTWPPSAGRWPRATRTSSRWTRTSATIRATCPSSWTPPRRGADLVLGSRYVTGGGTVNWGIGRQVISRGGSLYARTILGVDVRDLTGGFKCFNRRVLESHRPG